MLQPQGADGALNAADMAASSPVHAVGDKEWLFAADQEVALQGRRTGMDEQS